MENFTKSQLGKRDKKWALMLVNDSRTKAVQHHLEELLKDEGTSKYSLMMTMQFILIASRAIVTDQLKFVS